jgi:hypothetical protein
VRRRTHGRRSARKIAAVERCKPREIVTPGPGGNDFVPGGVDDDQHAHHGSRGSGRVGLLRHHHERRAEPHRDDAPRGVDHDCLDRAAPRTSAGEADAITDDATVGAVDDGRLCHLDDACDDDDHTVIADELITIHPNTGGKNASVQRGLRS